MFVAHLHGTCGATAQYAVWPRCVCGCECSRRSIVDAPPVVAHAARRTRAGGPASGQCRHVNTRSGNHGATTHHPSVAPGHRGNMTCTCKACGQQIPVKSTDTQITELVDEEGGAQKHATAPGNRKAEGEGGGQWQPIRGTTDRVDRGADMCDRGDRHCGHAPPPPPRPAC